MISLVDDCSTSMISYETPIYEYSDNLSNASDFGPNVYAKQSSMDSAYIVYELTDAKALQITIYAKAKTDENAVKTSYCNPNWSYGDSLFGIKLYSSPDNRNWRSIPFNSELLSVPYSPNGFHESPNIEFWDIYSVTNRNCLPTNTNYIKIEMGHDIEDLQYFGGITVWDDDYFSKGVFEDNCENLQNAFAATQENFSVFSPHPELNDDVIGLAAIDAMNTSTAYGSIVYEYPQQEATYFELCMYGYKGKSDIEMFTPTSLYNGNPALRMYTSADSVNWTEIKYVSKKEEAVSAYFKYTVTPADALEEGTKYIRVDMNNDVAYTHLYGGIKIYNIEMNFENRDGEIDYGQKVLLDSIVDRSESLIKGARLTDSAKSFDSSEGSENSQDSEGLKKIDAYGAICTYVYNLYGDVDVNPYFASLACSALLENPTPSNIAAVRNYIEWHLAHINPSGIKINGIYSRLSNMLEVDCPEGSIFDYTYELGENGTVVAEKLRYDARYGQTSYYDPYYFDSTDSYSAVFLSLLRKYCEVSGYDADIFTGENKDKIFSIIRCMDSTFDYAQSLTSAHLEYDIKYLMDNCETANGYADAGWILETVYGENPGDLYSKSAAVESAIVSRFWNNKAFDYAIGSSYRSMGFYPDATAQLYPIAFGIISPTDPMAIQAFDTFTESVPNWKQLDYPQSLISSEYMDENYSWPMIAYVASLMGRNDECMEFLANYNAQFLEGRDSYLTSSDAGWALKTAKNILRSSSAGQ